MPWGPGPVRLECVLCRANQVPELCTFSGPQVPGSPHARAQGFPPPPLDPPLHPPPERCSEPICCGFVPVGHVQMAGIDGRPGVTDWAARRIVRANAPASRSRLWPGSPLVHTACGSACAHQGHTCVKEYCNGMYTDVLTGILTCTPVLP